MARLRGMVIGHLTRYTTSYGWHGPHEAKRDGISALGPRVEDL